MTLPEITLPKIDLPFDIPVLIHPSVDHFAIALPVVILLLEFYNLFAKRKSIGVFSFFLLILTIVIFAAAYFTGVVDGKEAYDLLPQEGQSELKAHKLLGTYLLLGSLLLLFLKLLAMTGKKLLKVLFFIGLIGFIVVTFEQGKEGGELVYKYGANVERVKNIDDKLFDAQEALEDNQEKKTEKEVSVQPVVSTQAEQKATPAVDEVTKKGTQLEEKILEVQEKIKSIDETVETSVQEVKEVTQEPINTPSVNLDEAKPLEETNVQEENSVQEETVNTPKPTSLKTQSATTASHSVAQVETQEQVKLNPVPNNKEVTSIPKTPSVPEPIKVNESEETLVSKVGETIKDAASEESVKGYKESLEGLALEMKDFFDSK
jgi:uncharacterized membrane protein